MYELIVLLIGCKANGCIDGLNMQMLIKKDILIATELDGVVHT